MIAAALSLIFFFSGVSALLFENLWFYQAGITLGNSVWASSLVLAGFMGGLALGNALAARLKPGGFRAIRVYALLEVAIGVSGLALVVALPSLTSLLAGVFGPLLSVPWLANLLRLVCAFLLLLVPSTAMGATLPVMVSALYQRDPRFGSVLGRLYGWNTLGAVLGALAAHLVLIEAVEKVFEQWMACSNRCFAGVGTSWRHTHDLAAAAVRILLDGDEFFIAEFVQGVGHCSFADLESARQAPRTGLGVYTAEPVQH